MTPLEMTKISITGPKSQLREVVETLYELELMDIERYEDGEIESGQPLEEAEELSKTIVDIRSLISKLPEQDEETQKSKNIGKVQEKTQDLEEEIDRIQEEIDSLSNQFESIQDKIDTLNKLEGIKLNYQDLKGTDTLNVTAGNIDAEKLEDKAPNGNYEVFKGNDCEVVVYQKDEDMQQAVDSCTSSKLTLPSIDYEGSVEKIIEEKHEEKESIKDRIGQNKRELKQLSKKWRQSLVSAEEFLSEKIEKAEAPMSFGTTENAFIAKGWIPSKELDPLKEALCDITDGKIHIQEEEGENPPVKHDNPGIVQPFEPLTDLMSVPKYNEVDPSFVILLTFPALFGFMIGDAGYGLTSLLMFAAGYKFLPSGQKIFKSLMYASVFTVFFGLVFGDAFGYVIFGPKHNALYALTGLEFLKEIPILFHRAEHLGQVLPIAIGFGVFHINLGYLIGFYNEYTNHGFIEAFLEKGSWITLEVSALAAYLYGPIVGAPLGLISLTLLYKGEGIEGIVEIPSLIANILSYLRVFGVSIAAVALAKVVNGLAAPAFNSGTALGLAAGTAILIFGHTFNTFIKILEGFLQGIRLHYVEMFGKFYEGGGKKYAPFGATNS